MDWSALILSPFYGSGGQAEKKYDFRNPISGNSRRPLSSAARDGNRISRCLRSSALAGNGRAISAREARLRPRSRLGSGDKIHGRPAFRSGVKKLEGIRTAFGWRCSVAASVQTLPGSRRVLQPEARAAIRRHAGNRVVGSRHFGSPTAGGRRTGDSLLRYRGEIRPTSRREFEEIRGRLFHFACCFVVGCFSFYQIKEPELRSKMS